MFKVGEFAQLGRVSVKMLRHYDELGLLKPARVDPDTEYRYYTAAQLPPLHRIVALRRLGFTLEQVRGLLAADLPTEQIRGMLKLKHAEIEQRLLAEQERLLGVEERIRQLEQTDRFQQYDVVIRSLAPQAIATIHASEAEVGTTIEDLFDEVETYVARHQARATAPPLLLRHDTEHGGVVEVAVPILYPVPANDRVSVYDLVGVDIAACVMHTGSYVHLDRAADALHVEIAARGYQPAGPLRAVYFRFGAKRIGYDLPASYLTPETAAYVTELQVPLERAS